MNYNDIIYAKKMGGGAPALIAKSIAENGTYNAADDEADGYSSVTVDVPYNSKTKSTPARFTIQKNLEEITIPYGCTSIGPNDPIGDSWTTTGFPNLKHINIPNTVTTLEASCFSGMESLESIDIPSSVTVVGSSAFSSCKSLKEIHIPINAQYNNVNSQNMGLFSGCNSLVHFTIPSATTLVQTSCFMKCSSLIKINVDGENVLPEGITEFRDGSFHSCTSLQEIRLPSTLTKIGGAFDGCTSLTSIEIPAAVETIDAQAFTRCTALETITVHKAEGSITGAPWGAPNATVVWTG